MEQQAGDIIRQRDHDLLIELRTMVSNIAEEIKRFTAIQNALDMRVRQLEDSIVKLMPIPSVSHEQVVQDINIIKSQIVLLENSKNFVLGGWRIAVLFFGTFTGIISLGLTLYSIFWK